MTTKTKTTWRKLRITSDSGANVKVLKQLENKDLIQTYDVMLEGGRENKKIKSKVHPVGVWNCSRFDECIWGNDNDNIYDEIRKIIGKDKIEDAMYLEAHIRNKHDYFVTEDNDFLSKRIFLKEKFGANICTPKELKTICNNRNKLNHL